MASSTTRLAVLKASSTYQILPDHHQQTFIDHLMNSEMPWTKPQDGEVFESPEHCLKRLNIWAFLEGGCFVTGRLRKDKGTYEYPCAYYGELRNKRDLEDRVVKEEDKIVL